MLEEQNARPVSCTECAKRKVRCDKVLPACRHCKRRNESCIYPGRTTAEIRTDQSLVDLNESSRNSQSNDSNAIDLVARGTKRSNGHVNASQNTHGVDDETGGELTEPDGSRKRVRGEIKLVKDGDASHYIQAPMWFSWVDATKENQTDGQHQTQEERRLFHTDIPESRSIFSNLLGHPVSRDVPINTMPLSEQHPQPQVVQRLWKAFLSNVHPLVNIFFRWQVEPLTTTAVEAPKDLSGAQEALIFAIYFISILSLREEECESLLHTEKPKALDQFQSLSESALLRAGFIDTSDRAVLQAMILYVHAMRNRIRPTILFSFMGIIVRNAERLGYHRDGLFLSLPPAETEIRRRIWCQIQQVEIMIAQILGCTSMTLFSDWDARIPSNLDDRDFRDPNLTAIPPERTGLTSMSACLWQYNILKIIREARDLDGSRLGMAWVWSKNVTQAERISRFDLIEKTLNEKFVQYCEPLEPLHVYIQIGVRSFILAARRVILQPGLADVRISEMPSEVRDEFLLVCCKCLEYYVMQETMEELKPYSWHTENYFQWTALVYVVIEAYHHAEEASSERLWRLVDKVYSVHPKLASATDRTSIASIGRLVLRSWQRREEYLKRVQSDDTERPRCIVILRDKLMPPPDNAVSQASELPQIENPAPPHAEWDGFIETLDETSIDWDIMDLSFWDTWAKRILENA